MIRSEMVEAHLMSRAKKVMGRSPRLLLCRVQGIEFMELRIPTACPKLPSRKETDLDKRRWHFDDEMRAARVPDGTCLLWAWSCRVYELDECNVMSNCQVLDSPDHRHVLGGHPQSAISPVHFEGECWSFARARAFFWNSFGHAGSLERTPPAPASFLAMGCASTKITSFDKLEVLFHEPGVMPMPMPRRTSKRVATQVCTPAQDSLDYLLPHSTEADSDTSSDCRPGIDRVCVHVYVPEHLRGVIGEEPMLRSFREPSETECSWDMPSFRERSGDLPVGVIRWDYCRISTGF